MLFDHQKAREKWWSEKVEAFDENIFFPFVNKQKINILYLFICRFCTERIKSI